MTTEDLKNRVITGLEVHYRMQCSVCPYYNPDDDHCDRKKLFDDAIGLINRLYHDAVCKS